MQGLRSYLPAGKPGPDALERLKANNRLAMLTFFALPPLAGPAASIILVGGGLNGWYRLLAGNLEWPKLRAALVLAVLFALFPLAEFASWSINSWQFTDLKFISSSLLFLFALPSFARLSLSPLEDIWKAIYRGASIACIGAGLVSVIAMSLGDDRAEGGAGNPVPFSVVLSVLLPIAVSGWKDADQRSRQMVAAALVLGITAITLSGTRSMMIAAFVNLVITGVFLSRATVPFRRIAGAGLAIVVFGALVAGSSSSIQRHLTNTFRDIEAIQKGDNSMSAGRRLKMWQAGAELIAERPLAGYGPQSVTRVLQERTAKLGVQDGLSFTHFHNLAINAWIRGGLFEFVAAMLVLFGPWLLCLGTLRRTGFGNGHLIATVLFVSYLINSAISSGFWHDILTALYVQTAVCALFLCHQGTQNRAS
jgi:O-antigen ligase